MEIIPPELMNDEKPQIDRKHREQKGSDKENHASRHVMLKYKTIKEKIKL